MIQLVRNSEFVPTGYVGPIQQIRKLSGLKGIQFYDGVASLEIPFSIVKQMKFRGDWRPRTARLEAVINSIREKGFLPFDPIICRITRKRKCHVIDGGHRLTAARIVDCEFWPNLFSRKVKLMYFLVFESPERWSKVKRIADSQSPAGEDGEPPPGVKP